jgi:hypothetical protein
VAPSLAVSIAALKYGGYFTQPICRDVETTVLTDSPSCCGKTKFHSSPSVQSILQNPSLLCHFAINPFGSSSASANALMIFAWHFLI